MTSADTPWSAEAASRNLRWLPDGPMFPRVGGSGLTIGDFQRSLSAGRDLDQLDQLLTVAVF